MVDLSECEIVYKYNIVHVFLLLPNITKENLKKYIQEMKNSKLWVPVDLLLGRNPAMD